MLLQVNVAEKETQFGLRRSRSGRRGAARWPALPGLALDGLMCIAPEVDDAEETRPAFRRLATLFAELEPAPAAAGHPWGHLSMGMTNDLPRRRGRGGHARPRRPGHLRRAPAAPAAT